MDAAHGGQILLSQATRDLVEHRLPKGVSLRDMGEHRLKDLQQPSHLFQLVIAGLPTDFPPLKTLDICPNNLPVQPTPLIGREKEVDAIGQLIRHDDVRLVSLTGPGGMGKTRLALQAAAELGDQFADGVYFVDLAPISDSTLVIPTIAQALSLWERGSLPLLERLKEELRQKRMLLLLDNFEQVIDAAIDIADLLAACPQLKLVITSRTVLRVRAEREFIVPPLSHPDPAQVPDISTLSQYAAIALFIQRAQAVRPDFQLTAINAPAVVEIAALYWLLRTSVRGRDLLRLSRPSTFSLSDGTQTRSSREMFLMHKRKQASKGSEPAVKACTRSRKGLSKTSSDKKL